MDKVKIAVVGGSGLTGTELVKIILNHQFSELNMISSRTYAGQSINEVFPGIGSQIKFVESIKLKDLKAIDVLFICLPPGDSMKYLQKIEGEFGGMIIDVGSDFRISDAEGYQKWYAMKHLLPHLLKKFVYGLPEIYGDKLKGKKYIANPGCYPTSVLLSLYPVLKSGIADPHDLIIDSKSGVSGAGRKVKDPYMFIHLNENFYAYSEIGHRHIGEIEQEIVNMCGKKAIVSFTPHLLPITRGIFTSIYLKAENIDASELENLYKKYYGNSLFVHYMKSVPQLKDVAGTNNCLMSAAYDRRTGILKVFSAIDNLLKGAAGQAVQNMNIALGLKEDEGLNFQATNT